MARQIPPLHPDDEPLFEILHEVAFNVADAAGLTLRTFEPKARPHRFSAVGLCYTAEARITITLRFRLKAEAGGLWTDPRPLPAILSTVAHELAHLRHARHGKEHRAYWSELLPLVEAEHKRLTGPCRPIFIRPAARQV